MSKKLSEAASLMGQLGGLKGGPARAKSMTKARRKEIAQLGVKARNKALGPEERSEIARKAAAARYGKKGAKRGAKKEGVAAARSPRAGSRAARS